MTPGEAGNMVTAILGSWPSQAAKIDKKSMTIGYAMGLMDLDYELAMAAVRELTKVEVFIPAIATIRAKVVAMHHGERRSGGEAWGDVIREVKRVGRERRPQFADQITAGVVANFGWTAICNSNETDSSIRARFIEQYDQVAARGYQHAALSQGAKSHQLPARMDKPTLLGDIAPRLLSAMTTTEEDGHED